MYSFPLDKIKTEKKPVSVYVGAREVWPQKGTLTEICGSNSEQVLNKTE